MNAETGAMISPNLVYSRFTHFICDKMIWNDSKSYDMSTFHATQMTESYLYSNGAGAVKSLSKANRKEMSG